MGILDRLLTLAVGPDPGLTETINCAKAAAREIERLRFHLEEEIRLRVALQAILRRCGDYGTEPLEKRIHDIEELAFRALGIGAEADAPNGLRDLRHTLIAAIGFIGGGSILSKEQVTKLLADAVENINF